MPAVCEHGKVGNERCDDCYIEFGVIQERAAVVAWLRTEASTWGPFSETRGAWESAADAIERGEHVKGE